MKNKNLLDHISSFLDLTPDWCNLHVKLESSQGRREFFYTNQQPAPEIPPAPESTIARLRKIQSVPPEQRPQEGEDFEWFKSVQLALGGNQIQPGDSAEQALAKMLEKGVQID